MRNLEEVFQNAEFVHHLQRGRMHGVAAEVAEEVLMLLQHGDRNAGTRQQIPQHHARRSAADDATGSLQLSDCHECLFPSCMPSSDRKRRPRTTAPRGTGLAIRLQECNGVSLGRQSELVIQESRNARRKSLAQRFRVCVRTQFHLCRWSMTHENQAP